MRADRRGESGFNRYMTGKQLSTYSNLEKVAIVYGLVPVVYGVDKNSRPKAACFWHSQKEKWMETVTNFQERVTTIMAREEG